MKYQSIILAGGKGERLYPITETIPKPLCKVGGKSVILRCAEKIAECGIENIKAVIRHKAECFEKDKQLREYVSLCTEENDVGTAGALLCFTNKLYDTLAVSGDIVFDFDLRKVLSFHEANNSAFTVVLTRSQNPTGFGVAVTKNNIISSLIEKPEWKNVISDKVNTGIYVMSPEVISLIPADTNFDIAKDLIPAAIKRGIKIYGYEANGFWQDIGNPADYYKVCMKFPPYVDNSADVSPKSLVISTVIMNNTHIGKGCRVTNSIICDNVTIGENAVIEDGCIIGGGSEIESGAYIAKESIIAPFSHISSGETISHGTSRFDSISSLFDGKNKISGKYGEEITPEFCAKLGYALGGTFPKIGVLCACDSACDLLSQALTSGIKASGAALDFFGNGYYSIALFCVENYKNDLTVYIHGSCENIELYLLKKAEYVITNETIKQIEKSLKPPASEVKNQKSTVYHLGEDTIEKAYGSWLKNYMGDMTGCVFAFGSSSTENRFLTDILLSQNAVYAEGCGFLFDIDGESLIMSTKCNNSFPFWVLACGVLSTHHNENITSLPSEAPDFVTRFLTEKGIICIKDSSGVTLPFLFNPMLLCVEILKALRSCNNDFTAFTSILPQIHLKNRVFKCNLSEKAALCGELFNHSSYNDSIKFATENGKVSVIPTNGEHFKIYAEAASSEAADELCDFAENIIYSARKRISNH